ncbi:MAG: 2-amino-4-hydroxy-6-hydroxymethyldihydropteridine diphosphokinase [Bacteroidales bacterium]|nr:2-amino-4-hydroxy-6-hydroxymethyldihydropteridine diphosphokinase [Bacteroidales bacterium]
MKITLGFGSNLGERKETIEQAYEFLEKELGEMISKSSFIETEPWGFTSDNMFMNSVAVFETEKTPMQALEICNVIEEKLGRRRSVDDVGYASRSIDIDILFCDSQIIDTQRLKVPHPLIEKRDFVLNPLKEIMPEFIHPLIGKKIIDIFSDK